MNDTMASSWRDPGYLATVVSVLAFGALVSYIALTDGSPSPGSVAVFAVVGGVLAWLAQYLRRRM